MDRTQIKKRLFFWYTIFWIILLITLYLAYGVYFIDITSTKSKWVAFFAGVTSILFSSLKILEHSFYNEKHAIFDKITSYFSKGVFTFGKRTFKIGMVFTFLISCFLIKPMGSLFVLTFVCGSFFSFLAMLLSTFFNTKATTEILKLNQENTCFIHKKILDKSSTISFLVLGISIVPLVVLYHITKDYQILNGYALGSVFCILLNNVSMAISRQASQDASNVVCNYVAQIDKKDKRNPLLLLNGISKNLADANIFTGDIFSSFVVVIIATMTIGGEYLMLMGAFLPLIIVGSAIFASILTILFASLNKLQNLITKFFASLFFANFAFILICTFVIKIWYPDTMRLLVPIITGSIIGSFICFINSNNIFSKYQPILNVSNSAVSGFIAVLKQILRECFGGIIFPAIAFVALIIISFLGTYGLEEPSYGVYGVLLATLSSISMVGIISTIVNFAFIINGSKNILETYEENVEENTFLPCEFLKEFSFNILALGKNFVNFSSIIVSIGALIAYSVLANLSEADILNPYVMSALIIGAVIPFAYSALVMGVISKTARRLVLEAKKQFKKFPQILRFEMRPDYEKCVDISALNSAIQVVFNTGIIVLIFAIISIYLKYEALLGFVFGSILSTFVLIYISLFTSNISKSAKKYFITQFGKMEETEEYQAIDLNNKIFNSFASFIVPSLCSLIKFITILALAFIPLIVPSGAM